MLFLIDKSFHSKTGKRIAYHSSDQQYHIGEIVGDPKYKKDKGHWGTLKKTVELMLETVRKKKFSNKPSRLTSLYCSPYKDNPFSDRGFLYEVELIGDYHYADSEILFNLVDQISVGAKAQEILEFKDERYQLCIDYWNGVLKRKKDIEIVTQKFKILKKIGREIDKGDIVTTVKPTNVKFVLISRIFDRTTFFKKWQEKFLDSYNGESGLIKTGILKKGVQLKIEYVPEKYKGKINVITGTLIGDDTGTEISLEENNLIDFIKKEETSL